MKNERRRLRTAPLCNAFNGKKDPGSTATDGTGLFAFYSGMLISELISFP
jgi:hypothetical protein